jgi:hypothetical protein
LANCTVCLNIALLEKLATASILLRRSQPAAAHFSRGEFRGVPAGSSGNTMKAPVKAGMEWRMKEPHRKGVANHPDPESCAGGGNSAGEALTGAHTGQPSSSEITSIGVPTLYCEGEGHTSDSVHRKLSADAAESETLSMRGNFMRGNRETPKTSTSNNAPWATCGEDRSEKAVGRTSDMHVSGESDRSIVPKKRTNKAGPPAAESVEERGLTKGNATRTLLAPDTAPGKRGMGLLGVREAAKRDKAMRFTALLHHVCPELLRVADRRILRLMRKWLRAGVSEDGKWSRTTVGTPQGAVISPILANVFLHYVFDLWVNQWRKRHARGEVIVVRYADDFVMGFQYRDDAERCLRELRDRLAKFGLELHPEKTRLIEFGRYAAERRSERGEGKPETFNFLGFTHCCGKTRRGAFTIKRKSIAKRMRAKLQEVKQQLIRQMHRTTTEVGAWLRSVVRGWFNYHAVPGNRQCLDQFRTQVARLWLHVVRRRSQKGCRWTWARMTRLIQRWLPKAHILHPYPNERLIVNNPR